MEASEAVTMATPTRSRPAARRGRVRQGNLSRNKKKAGAAKRTAAKRASSPREADHPATVCSGSSAEKTVLGQTPVPLETSPQPLERNKEKTVTVKEAAYRLGKSEDAVYLWLRSGRLKGWQPGGRRCAILVVEASIAEALAWSLGGNGKGLQALAQ